METTARKLWNYELALRGINWIYRNSVEMAYSKYFEAYYIEKRKRNPQDFLDRFEIELKYLEPSTQKILRRLIKNKINSLENGKKGTDTLLNRIQMISKENEEILAKIPNSLEKAKGFLLAFIDNGDYDDFSVIEIMCSFKEEVSQDLILQLVSDFKGALQRTIDRQKQPISIHNSDTGETEYRPSAESRNQKFLQYRFWSSKADLHVLNDVTYYRFLTEFRINDFPETIREIEEDYENELDFYDLWIVSRSNILISKIRKSIDINLRKLIQGNYSNGPWWDSSIFDERIRSFLPSKFKTAFSALVILKLSREEKHKEIAIKSIEWLMTQQNPKGYWTLTQSGKDKKIIEKEDIYLTLIILSGVSYLATDRYNHSIKLAEKWILSQQHPSGFWTNPNGGIRDIFLTNLIINYFDEVQSIPKKMDNYLEVAKNLIERGRDLIYEDNIYSKNLSIIIVFQALESFMYGCLSHPAVNIKIFQKGETIGFNSALTQLQNHFQANKTLKGGKVIEFRNQMDRIKYLRDQIVHKAVIIGQGEGNELIQSAYDFMNLNSQRIFGFKLMK